MDRGAWRAGVHGVAQSQTQLKWFSMDACIGEGNGNQLQYSCLENPQDRGAWWAAVCGVTHSWTRLKWLSSSSKSQWSGRNGTKGNNSHCFPGQFYIIQFFYGIIVSLPATSTSYFIPDSLVLSVKGILAFDTRHQRLPVFSSVQ